MHIYNTPPPAQCRHSKPITITKMGICIFWLLREPLTQAKFDRAAARTRLLCECVQHEIPLDYEITNQTIKINGVGDDAHETFIIQSGDVHMSDKQIWKTKPSFFVKTNLKPYDSVVAACLILIKLELGDGIVLQPEEDISIKYGHDLLQKYLPGIGDLDPDWKTYYAPNA